jgi:hypothetical protein
MQLAGLFDPATLFDLMFFYSELQGIGTKYVRYVSFVEQDILPTAVRVNEGFYDAEGHLLPQYRANMDRLKEYRDDTQRMSRWARCLAYRLETTRIFDRTCNRADYLLEGMEASVSGASPQ